MRYLMTHSLLASWLRVLKENPFEDLTTEADPYAEFLQTLKRQPIETTEAMRNGILFEDMVTAIVKGGAGDDKWGNAAGQIAAIVKGGQLQFRASKKITVNGMDFLLYGRLDALKAGVVYDIKFSKSYDRGKYLSSTQHPTYLEIVPEATRFIYLVSNGTDVWTEQYSRDDTPSIIPIISDFVDWLNAVGLMDTYKEHWAAL